MRLLILSKSRSNQTGDGCLDAKDAESETEGINRENKLIDDLDMHENRAASLSAMNMGVNMVEIAALFASSIFSLNAVKWCFVLVGGVLLIFNIPELRPRE